MTYAADFEKALQLGRPPNIKALFPTSRALIVSGKVVDRAIRITSYNVCYTKLLRVLANS